MRYWDPVETTSRDELIDLQNTRLYQTVRMAFDQSTFYQERFNASGVDIESFKGLDDLRKLPFTEPADLLSDPRSICVNSKKIATLRCSGGTSDTPKILFRTETD